MIRMINGWTKIDGKVFTPDDGAFSAAKSVEKRLVACGVAEYADETPTEPMDEPILSEPEDADEPILPEPEDTLDEEQLKRLTNDELKEMAESMGMDVGGCRKKADYIGLILEAEGADVPDNTAEEPVV